MNKVLQFFHWCGTPRNEDPNFCVGTLKYSPAKLLYVCFIMLFGGMAYSFLGLISGVFSITLFRFNASAQTIAVIAGILPAVFNATVCPVVSFRSDRTRSKWGRRIPYLLIPAPFLGLSLVLMGFSPQLADFISNATGWSRDNVGICIFAFALCIYEIFYMFVGSVYYYLFNDVIPTRWVGVFNALFHFTGSILVMCYSFFIFRYVEFHAVWVYTGIGVTVFLCYMINGFCIKEGEYPPLPAESAKLDFFQGVKVFCKECFAGHPFYLIFFTMTAMTQVSTICRGLYGALFATTEGGINLSFETVGRLGGIAGIVGICCTIPIGSLNSIFKPIYVYTVGMVLVIFINVYGFFCVWDATTYLIAIIALRIAYAAQNNSEFPLNAQMLPRDRFGQFASAQSIFRSVIRIAATFAAGFFINAFGYRYLFVWDFGFTVIQFLLVLWVFYYWRKLGGAKNFVAP